MGEVRKEALRVEFDSPIRLEFHGTAITSDVGLVAYREFDEALSLTEMADEVSRDSRQGQNTPHKLTGLLRQSVCSRLTHKRANGQRVGSIPYGFDLDADGMHLLPNEEDQVTIAQIHPHAHGRKDIAEDLCRAHRARRSDEGGKPPMGAPSGGADTQTPISACLVTSRTNRTTRRVRGEGIRITLRRFDRDEHVSGVH